MVINPGQATDLIALAQIVKGLSAEGVEETLQELEGKFSKLHALSTSLATQEAGLNARAESFTEAERKANELTARAEDMSRRADASFADARQKNTEAVERLKYANDTAQKAEEAIVVRLTAIETREAALAAEETRLADLIAKTEAIAAEYEGKLSQLKSIAG